MAKDTRGQSAAYRCERGHFVSERQERCPTCRTPRIEIEQRDRLVSHSFISDLERCDRYAYFRRFLHLQPKHVKTESLDAGTLWHYAMRAWHSGKGTLEQRLQEAEEAIRTRCQEFPSFPCSPIGSDPRNVEQLLYILHQYVKFYGEHDIFKAREIEGVCSSETEYFTELTGSEHGEVKPILHTGIIDQVGEMQDGSLCIVDYKLTRMLTSGGLEQMKMSHQWNGYIYAAQQLLGTRISRVIIDVVGLYKSFNPAKHFVRIMTNRTEKQIQNWKDQVIRKWERWEQLKQSRIWDQTTSNCGRWNQKCPYMDPCEFWNEPLMDSLLHAEYEVSV